MNNWLIVKGNKIYYREEVYGYTSCDFLFASWKIKGKNPVIIEGQAVTEIRAGLFSNRFTTKKMKIKIYNPIMEIASSKEKTKNDTKIR